MFFDLVIENGKLVFGDMKKPEILNIGIKEDRIVEISKLPLKGEKTINATGKIVSPGFIDPHTHSDLSAFFEKEMSSKVLQGVTTEINGNCGIGIFPYLDGHKKEFIEFVNEHFFLPEENFSIENMKNMDCLRKEWEQEGFIVNQGYLLGTGCIRIAIVGFTNKKLTEEQTEDMLNLLEQELKKGIYGVSFGLIYQPGNFMDRYEIAKILKLVAKYSKIASFHMRNEGADIIESIKEVIWCAKQSKCRVNISHLKIMDKGLWGKAKEILSLIADAKESGVDISFDQYPYIATSTNMMVLIPDKIFDGDIKKFIDRIPHLSDKEKNAILDISNKRGGISNMLISSSFIANNKFSGKLISEIKEELGLNEVDTILYLIKESEGKARVIYFSMSEEDMYTFMENPLGVIGSDGNSFSSEDDTLGIPHPRNYGTFTRFIKINREKKMFSLEEMINRITLKTAEIFNIKERGLLKEGYFADITIFDYDQISDGATFNNPFIKNNGIEYVIVNGKIAVCFENITDERAGKLI
ncbi:MAG: amidohydrolase family protein [Fusobacteriaceae bacterium]|jgi:N-acyl-D-amino-acid deacylase|nr:amidohydrolase family protein [Fusobacteriaceae bacterium]